MDRVGTLLSLTFIFGYIEGLLDINKWIESKPSFPSLFPKEVADNKINHALASILVMSIIHIFALLQFYSFTSFLNK